MREIDIEVFDDKSIKVKNDNLGDKFDNQITQINFIFDSCKFKENLIYTYLAIQNELRNGFDLIDITDTNNIIIDKEFTKNYLNSNNCLFILSDKVLNEYFKNDIVSFVSNQFTLKIQDNFLIENNYIIKENKEGI